MNIATHRVEVPFPQAFASPRKKRSSFPSAPRYGSNVVPPIGRHRWPLGEHALSCEILRWLFHCCLMNTVAFLPQTLRLGTHRNTIQLSKC
jgi:hypothetical protein